MCAVCVSELDCFDDVASCFNIGSKENSLFFGIVTYGTWILKNIKNMKITSINIRVGIDGIEEKKR